MQKESRDKIKLALIKMKESIIFESQKADNGQFDLAQENRSDIVDRSNVESERNFLLRLLDRDRKLMKKIESAIARIDNDEEYGICKSCGDQIGLERLLARPVTDLCIVCKEEEEQKEASA